VCFHFLHVQPPQRRRIGFRFGIVDADLLVALRLQRLPAASSLALSDRQRNSPTERLVHIPRGVLFHVGEQADHIFFGNHVLSFALCCEAGVRAGPRDFTRAAAAKADLDFQAGRQRRGGRHRSG
jgi:hypothetical protein